MGQLVPLRHAPSQAHAGTHGGAGAISAQRDERLQPAEARAGRVVTPGGCQIGYVDRTGLSSSGVLTAM
jgi:hypothetical protein